MTSGSRRNSVHVFYVLEAVSQVADKGMVDMLEHASFSDNISNTFGFDDLTTLSVYGIKQRKSRQ